MRSTIDNASRAPDSGAKGEIGRPLDRDELYHRSLEATRNYPDSVGAWLNRAETARSIEERIYCLSQANRLDPNHPKAKEQMHQALWSELERDSFLAYLDETDQVYHVRNRNFLSLAISKDRARFEAYGARKPTRVDRAQTKLAWAALGITLAGLGTLIFAPMAIWSALSAMGEPLSRADRARGWIVIFISLVLMIIALFLGWLFLIHF